MASVLPGTTGNHGRRWLGVLLSLFVPGFGLARTGRFARAAVWFLAVQIIGVFAVLLISRNVPSWVALGGISGVLLCQLWMLADSFRPGKVHAKRWVPIFAAAFIIVVCIASALHLCFQTFSIPNGSMEPVLRGPSQGTPDQIIVERVAYRLSPPKRGDLVVVRRANVTRSHANVLSVRRVVGLPGEKIEISDGRLLADGRQLGESDGIPSVDYALPPLRLDASKTGIYTVPQHSYFVLGDQSSRSIDSRYLGPLPETSIYGRVARIYYPFSRFSVPR